MKNMTVPYWTLALLLAVTQSQASEFNEAFLDTGNKDKPVNLDAFARPNFVPPGQYLVDVYVNQRFIEQLSLHLSTPEGSDTVQACLPPFLAERLGLKEDALAQLQGSGDCLDLSRLSGASQRYIKSASKLALSIPQAFLLAQDDRSVPPALWKDGIPAALLDYRLSYQHRHDPIISGSDDNALGAYGTAGLNVGPWRLRSNFNYDSRTKRSPLSWNQTQLSRDIPQLYSRLALGEVNSSNSGVFENFTVLGASLGTRDEMIPASLRGYAPRVEGIAQSNAKVTIRSQGNIVDTQVVPPGPFSLTLNSGVQGKLDVTVEEADGSVQVFSVYNNSTPYLSRQGQVRFQTAVGKALVNNKVSDEMVGSLDASWGINDFVSLYGGLLLNKQYQALALGTAYNLGVLGALSVDVTQSHARIQSPTKQDTTLAGRSYRLQYAKLFAQYDMGVSLAAYRFSDRRYWGFNDYLQYQADQAWRQKHQSLEAQQWDANAQRWGKTADQSIDYSRWRQEKQRLELRVDKRFGALSTSLSATRQHYWNAASQQYFNLYLGRSVNMGELRNVSLGLAFTLQQRNIANQRSVKQVAFNFSVPLERSRSIYSSTNWSSNSTTTQNVSFNDSGFEGHSYGVNVSAGKDKTQQSVGGYYRYEGERAISDIWVSHQVSGHNTVYASTSSSLLLHAKGMTASKASSGSTRVLVDTEGVADIALANDSRTRTDDRGFAVTSYTSPYQRQTISLDTTKLPENAEVKQPIQNVVLTHGAVGLARFKVAQGRRLLTTLTLPSGQKVPLGATVIDANTHQELGLVGEDGVAYLTGILDNSAIEARWGQNVQCVVSTLPSNVDISQGLLPLTCQ